MAELKNVYSLSQNIDTLRMRMLKILYDDSRRAIEFDSDAIRQVEKLRVSMVGMVHVRSVTVQHHYSPRPRKSQIQQSNIDVIPQLIKPPRLKIANIIIGEKTTTFKMTPKWFNPDDQAAVLKSVIYPDGIIEKRSFNTVARYRAIMGKTNDFRSQTLQVGDSQTETLVLALDAFARLFGGDLSFTNEDLSFEESAHRTACGVANLSSAHLLAADHVPTAKLTFNIGISYKELSKSEETMENFAFNFIEAIVEILGCEYDYIRILSVDQSAKSKEESQVTFGITTPSQEKTEEYVQKLRVQ